MILADHARYRVLKVFEDLDAVMRIIKKDVQGFRVHFGDLADRTAASLETFQRATSFKDKFVYTRWFFELVSRMYRSYDNYLNKSLTFSTFSLLKKGIMFFLKAS
ncbi:MAG: hypothetical protein GWO20_04215 [Candidatus Korarchaeota archaeon]|nr:hypothetical protein [Candidatus Korarchaeota archaeon]NIU82612.1 hypothetical protein [Candidatus Thorarchaeota archaeon]NIW13097.1 hypothetical protein [Candidatus Thorarchaeota archaeon]NIW51249.1 hypothetical protein [Candidatus Korarchaeota archaeon]